MNILVASGGRRPYLTRWFKEALTANNVEGSVVVADLDPYSPSQSEADAFFNAPRVSDPSYVPWLRHILEAQSIDLAVSINDFELSVWSSLYLKFGFDSLLTLSSEKQEIAEDKFSMGTALFEGEVPAPTTVLASQLSAVDLQGDFVVKGRFGSGSRGLGFASADDIETAIDGATREVTDPSGLHPETLQDAMDLIVVQPLVPGQEYGLDVVNDLDGKFVTVLARKKIAMRGGETDKAMTVDPSPFRDVAQALSAVTQHRGLIDVDVIQDPSGQIHVIDVNPRFGGGYPFSHVAGADIPAAYVAWSLGRRPRYEWLTAKARVFASKYVDVATVAADR